MSRLFVSYSRSDRPRIGRLIPLLREVYGIENVWWDENFYGGQVWWDEILQQIAACDVFLYLMSPRSLGSPYCQAELEEARRLRKPILPVKVRRETDVPEILARLHYVNLTGGINRATIPPLLRAINEHASRPPSNLPPLSPNPVPLPLVPHREPRNWLADYAAQILIGMMVTIFGGVFVAWLIQADRFNPSAAPPAVVVAATDTPAPNPPDPVQMVAQTQTREAAQTLTAQPTATPTATINFQGTVDALATETRAFLQTAQAATLTAQPTATPTTPPPTADPLQAALERARTFSGGNTDWQPFLWTFDDGIEMALVPAGCFMMGSESGNDDERPVHEQCLEPFYIDRTEVTQADFERLRGVKANAHYFDGDDRPVENITWFEARDFCALRGARLPTEAEWEYAARGPDGLVYPWGNDFVADNVVYDANSNSETANVGSRPGGASWVGAYDVSGNVWEWVSSIYADYPYDTADGREDINRTDGSRVLRGGSWNSYVTNVRAANRVGSSPDYGYDFRGFRCARS